MSKILLRLARQWMKEQGISCMALSVEFIYLTACLARQWIKLGRGIINIYVRTKSGTQVETQFTTHFTQL